MISKRSAAALLSTTGGRGCPVCGASVEPAVDLGDYRLFRCAGCGSWSSDALVRGARTSFEPSRYFQNPHLDGEKWNALLQRIHRGGRQMGSVLDVGCGNGAFLAFMGQRWPDVRREGIEIDHARGAEARERDPEGRIHTGDAVEAIAETAAPFDLITLWDVFEHVPAPAVLLKGLAGVLAPGGSIYIQTIHEHSLVPRLGRLSYSLTGGWLTYPVRRTHEPHHLVFFTRKGLEWAATNADLTIRELWFDRLVHGRMDGTPVITGITALLLGLENFFGNGLFVNLLLEKRPSVTAG